MSNIQTMKIYLSTSGTVADLRKNFPVIQGQYQSVNVEIFVPKTLLGEHFSVDIGSKTIDRNGVVHNSPKFFVPVTQDSVIVNGIDYAKFQTLIPSEFTKYASYGANAMTMVINVTNSTTQDNQNVIDTIVTSQEVRFDVLPSTRLIEPSIHTDELTALKQLLNGLELNKQDKVDNDLETANKSVVGAINSLNDDINNVDTGLKARVTKNEGDIAQNTQDILDNADNINLNTQSINTLNVEVADHETRIGTNESDISINTQDIADLKQQAISGIDRIGVISQNNEPSDSQLSQFVRDNTTPSREPKNGDYVEWLTPSNGKRYKIFFTNSMWQAPDEVDNTAPATNKFMGVVRGTFSDDNANAVQFDVVSGVLKDIYILKANGLYGELASYINGINEQIDKILSGTLAVGKATNADNATNSVNATHATNAENATHAVNSDNANNANFATTAGSSTKATNDKLNRDIVETYAEKAEVYTKDQADDKFLPNTYSKIYYYSKEGIVDIVPSDQTPQFVVTSSSVGATEVFDINRVLANKYKFNKNTTDSSQIWVSADRPCTLKFRLTTIGVRGASPTTLAVDTTGEIMFSANSPKAINISTIYNQLADQIELVIGDKIEKKFEVITDFSEATQISVWSNETYPSTFLLVAQSITFDVNSISGKKAYVINQGDWTATGNGDYTITLTPKQLDIAPSTQYGMDMQYNNGYGWQRVLFTPTIYDNGNIKIVTSKARTYTLLVWIAVDIDKINEGGTRVTIGGEYVQDMALPKSVGDMINEAVEPKLDKSSVKNEHNDSTEMVYSANQTNVELNTRSSAMANRLKFNQLLDTAKSTLPTANGLTVTNIYGGHNVAGTTDRQYYHKMYELATISGHWYYFAPNFSNTKSVYILGHIDGTAFSTNKGKVFEGGSKFDAYIQIEKDKTMDFDVQPILVDLTEMFGSGNEPTTDTDVYLYFAKDTYYPYVNNVSKEYVDNVFAQFNPERNRIYGVDGVGGSNPTLTRTDSSVGKSYVKGTTEITSDFSLCYPYSEIKEVTDDFGNVFVKIPKFYTRVIDNGNGTYKHLMSGARHLGFSTLFVDGKGNEIDYVLVGKYEASGTTSRMYSKSGEACLVNININQARAAAKANGAGYQQYDFIIDAIIKELFMIEFATTNTQSVMRGYVDDNSAAVRTGRCDALATPSGSELSNTSGKSACKYRGIENPFGNVWKWVDGINFRNEEIWLCLDPSQYASDKFASPYEQVGVMAMTNGYAKIVKPFEKYPLLGYTTAVGGSESTYFSDYYYQNSGNRVLLVGGHWHSGSTAGLWSWSGYRDSSGAYSSFGCRLCYKPL